jgi:hypothetical protein
MAKGNSDLGSCVIVVGEPGSELVRTTVRLAGEGELDVVLCDNVYSATAGVAQAKGRRILVVGPIRDLADQNGVFFRIAHSHAARCCCLLDHRHRVGREDLRTALQSGVTIVGDVQDVGSVLTQWLTTASSAVARPPRATGDEGQEVRDDWRATETELRALLE